jgi:hypothetical protein
MNFDLSSVFAGVTLTVFSGCLTSFISLRKDERAIQIDQITKERSKWRENMRKLTEDIVTTYYEELIPIPLGKIGVVRARLASSINPKCSHDNDILEHFDNIFTNNYTDIDIFVKRISLLLKHDWERVKWDCMPIYMKPFIWFTKAQKEWRLENYRNV